MSKLTPPAPQNRAKRKRFFEAHPELPNAKAELERIEAQEKAGRMKVARNNIKMMILKSHGKKPKTKGAFGRPPEYLIKYKELEVV